MKIFDGKALAQKIRNEIKMEIKKLRIRPGLAVIMVGNDPASEIYVRTKKKAAEEAGIEFHEYNLYVDSLEDKITGAISFLNQDLGTNGIIVQLPLPKHLDPNKITQAITPEKDVDGFHPDNLKNLLAGKKAIIPPTSRAVMAALENAGENLAGKKIVILANSAIFAEPIIYLLKRKGLSAELVLGKEKGWEKKIYGAHVLVTAMGQPRAVKKEMVKDGVIVVDIGTSYINGKTVGDVDFENVKDKASFITPTPGGIGPLTVAFLLKNVLETAKV